MPPHLETAEAVKSDATNPVNTESLLPSLDLLSLKAGEPSNASGSKTAAIERSTQTSLELNNAYSASSLNAQCVPGLSNLLSRICHDKKDGTDSSSPVSLAVPSPYSALQSNDPKCPFKTLDANKAEECKTPEARTDGKPAGTTDGKPDAQGTPESKTDGNKSEVKKLEESLQDLLPPSSRFKPAPGGSPSDASTRSSNPEQRTDGQAEIDPSKQPASQGDSTVDSYTRKQGARVAGSNVAPPIDLSPRQPSQLVPNSDARQIPDAKSQPDATRDFRPIQPKTQSDGSKPVYNPFPDGPKKDGPAQTADKAPVFIPDANVKAAEFVQPGRDRPQLEKRYDTADVATALRTSKELGLPLVVHIGSTNCGPCRSMESKVWPEVEGDAEKKGSMEGKMVALHLNVDDLGQLNAKDQTLANWLQSGVTGYPTIRVFQHDGKNWTRTASDSGYMRKEKLEGLIISGSKKR